MFELIEVYSLTLLCGLIFSLILVLLGSLFVSNNQAIHIAVINQSSMVGINIGLILFHYIHFELGFLEKLFPLFFAIILSLCTYRLLNGKNTINSYIAAQSFAFFSLLWAINQVIFNQFKFLDPSHARENTNDLVLLSSSEAITLCIIGLIILIALGLNFKKLILVFFDQHFNFHSLFDKKRKIKTYLIQIFLLIIMAISNHFLGFYFTLGTMLIPVLTGYTIKKSLKHYLLSLILISSIGFLIGFLLSLKLNNLPTVPAILICYFILGLFFKYK